MNVSEVEWKRVYVSLFVNENKALCLSAASHRFIENLTTCFRHVVTTTPRDNKDILWQQREHVTAKQSTRASTYFINQLQRELNPEPQAPKPNYSSPEPQAPKPNYSSPEPQATDETTKTVQATSEFQ